MRKILILILFILFGAMYGAGVVYAACDKVNDVCCNLQGSSGAWTSGDCDGLLWCDTSVGTCKEFSNCLNVGDKCCKLPGVNGSWIVSCKNDLVCDLTSGSTYLTCKVDEKYTINCGKPDGYCCKTGGIYTCDISYNTESKENTCSESTSSENGYAVYKCGLSESSKINTCSCTKSGGLLENNCRTTSGKTWHCTAQDSDGNYNSCNCFTDSEWASYQNTGGFTDGQWKGKCLPGYVCDADLVCDVKTNICEKNDYFGICNCINGKLDASQNHCTTPSWATCVQYGQSDGSTVNRCLCMDPSSSRKGAIGLTTGDAVLPNYTPDSGFRFANATLGDVIGGIIKYIYIFAGFALIIVLIMGGFNVLTSAGVPEKAKIGYDKITQGITGFIIVFVSYMVVLLIQAIFKIKIFF